MQSSPALGQYGIVCDLLRERVLENVFCVNDCRSLVNELRELQVIHHPIEFLSRLSNDLAHR